MLTATRASNKTHARCSFSFDRLLLRFHHYSKSRHTTCYREKISNKLEKKRYIIERIINNNRQYTSLNVMFD